MVAWDRACRALAQCTIEAAWPTGSTPQKHDIGQRLIEDGWAYGYELGTPPDWDKDAPEKIAHFETLARQARSLGLIVVFGNGVATDIGNLGEYLVLAAGQGLFAAPSESSGFAKLREPLLGSVLAIGEGGRMTCSAAGAEIAGRLRRFAQRVG